MEAIRQVSVRLDRTIIEDLDWQECVRRYDRPATFFFFDPPYLGSCETSYKGWTEADILRLRETLAGVRGQWLLTLNDEPAVRRIFTGCELRPVERALGIDGRKGSRRYRELIITKAK